MTDSAILMVSFGVSDQKSRENSLDAILEDVRVAFPGYKIEEAYTSNFIRAKLTKQNILKKSLAEALSDLKISGIQKVFIQPTHLTPGEEFEKKIYPLIQAKKSSFQTLSLGEPVFFKPQDYDSVADLLLNIYPPSQERAVVLLGHGSPHQHNPVYERLQKVFDRKRKNIFVGVLEENDTPTYKMVHARIIEGGYRNVLLAPLLLSGGMHVNVDLAGEEGNSWNYMLKKDGISPDLVLQGLGEYRVFRQVYIKKLQVLIHKSTTT